MSASEIADAAWARRAADSAAIERPAAADIRAIPLRSRRDGEASVSVDK